MKKYSNITNMYFQNMTGQRANKLMLAVDTNYSHAKFLKSPFVTMNCKNFYRFRTSLLSTTGTFGLKRCPKKLPEKKLCKKRKSPKK